MTGQETTAAIRHMGLMPDGSVVIQIENSRTKERLELIMPPELVAQVSARLRQYTEVRGVTVTEGRCPRCQTESLVPMSKTTGDEEGVVTGGGTRAKLGCWRCSWVGGKS